jgi:peptide/nickel transport system permease protein
MNQMRPARIALLVILSVYLITLCSGFFAPYSYAAQNRDFPYAPPTRVHFVDRAGRLHLRPFVYAQVPGSGLTYHEDLVHAFPVEFFVVSERTGADARFAFPRRLFGVREPGVIFLLGADEYGRDVLSRLLYGGQLSLTTGLMGASISLTLGLVLGIAAGFYGGLADWVLMRCGELFLALPWLYLLLGIRAFLPLHVTPIETLFLLILVIGGVGWVRPARLIRGVVLSAKESDFVLAARGFGASDFHLMRRHILPSTKGVVLAQATILIPQYILAEVTLSFLGLGIGEPVPSWGNMLSQAREYHTIVRHPWMLAPGLILVPLTLCFIMLADSQLNLNWLSSTNRSNWRRGERFVRSWRRAPRDMVYWGGD